MKYFTRLLSCLGTLLLLICFISIPYSYSQETESDTTALQESAVKVFLDLPLYYHDYIKTEIPYVNYVRDRHEAQVHILMTTQETGSGGTEHTITFIGQHDFADMMDTLIYVSKQTDTEDIIRSEIVRVLKMGLMRYVAKTPLADQISISYRRKPKPTEVVDKWKNWVFSINVRSFLNGQESTNFINIHGSVSADRVTPEWKIRLSARTSYNESNYKIDDTTTISSISSHHSFHSTVVKSLGEHWSIGAYGSAFSSLYSNTKFSISAAPAIEYNVFPYSGCTRREFRLLYKTGYANVHYYEGTIFDKMHENLFKESLEATYEVKQKWGSIATTLWGSHYFHDFSKNSLGLWSDLSLRLFEGLSLTLYGSVSMIHDQLSLPKADLTQEDILLQRKQLATQYSYFASIGLRYSFGSIYSNVVNPRFGN